MKTRVQSFLIVLSLLGLCVTQRVMAQTFTNLHSFVFTNGTGPVAGLILSGNTLYGTTRIYGGGDGGGYGSVFRLNTDGSGFTNLHTFSGIPPEGGNLDGGLVLVGNTLYGTAAFGGALNDGCVFKINTDGSGLTNLYDFSPLSNSTNNDGAYPLGDLLLVGSTLYGSANGGGVNGVGSIFAVNTNGTAFTNLHNFSFATGGYPSAGLILSGGTLYGSASSGGSGFRGALFKINTNSTGFSDFYDFTTSSGFPSTNSDGSSPVSTLVLSGNLLYGTARDGGESGSGTIFKLNTNGTGFSVLHHFTATSGTPATNNDGAYPQAELFLAGNVLYGTAPYGGNSGNGTAFKINTDGSGFTVLHTFSTTNTITGTNVDGAHPTGGLILSGSTLYGTATAGGAAGYGTIFSIFVPPTLTIAISGTNVILTWPTNVNGFNLQSTTNIAPPANWDPVSGQYTVTNPISGKQKFYRLMHP
jgi:uncharacterized repeat protein (TIGR03803 family)